MSIDQIIIQRIFGPKKNHNLEALVEAAYKGYLDKGRSDEMNKENSL